MNEPDAETESFIDASLALERTVLSWQRFSLNVAVIGILSLRAALVGNHEFAGFAIAFVLAGLAAVMQIGGPKLRAAVAVRAALAATLFAAAGSLLLALLD